MPNRLLLLAMPLLAAQTFAADAPHPDWRILAADKGVVHVFDADGKSTWSRRVGGVHDLHRLPNGNVLCQSGMQRVVEIAPDKSIVWSFDGKAAYPDQKIEMHAVQRLPNGRTMIAVSGASEIIEVDRDGEIVKRFPMHVSEPHPHRDSRLVRKLENGHYLACHEGDGKVTEYDADGDVVWEYDVPLFGRERANGHGPEAWGNQCFAAVRLENGNTLVSTGNGHGVIEVTPEKEIVWRLRQHDLPGITLAWVTTLEVHPNGHIVLGNCHAGEGQPQLVEITRDKDVVWTFYNWDELGNAVSNSQILGVDGDVRR